MLIVITCLAYGLISLQRNEKKKKLKRKFNKNFKSNFEEMYC